VCLWAGFPPAKCNAVLDSIALHASAAPANRPLPASIKLGRAPATKKVYKSETVWPEYFYNTTWEMLEEANYDLAMRVSIYFIFYYMYAML
jgi:hypothetical protein